MKTWILRKEFFGGLLYNTKRKNYYCIDDCAYQYLSQLLNNQKKFSIDKKYLNFLIREGIIKISSDSKILFSGKEVKLQNNQSEYISSPMRIHFACTYLCPQKCKHCFVAKYKKQKNELTTKEIFYLIDSLVESGTYEILFAGGEPLMRKDIFECLEYAVNKGMSVKLFSNGLLLTDDKINALSKINLKSLTIGLDGSDTDVYNKIRNSDKYKKVVNNIMRAREKINYKIAIKYTVTKVNSDIETIKNMVNFSIQNDIVLMLRAVKPCGNALENENLLLDYNEYLNILLLIEKEYQLNKNKGLKDEENKFLFKFSKRSVKFEESPLLYLGWGCLGGYIHAFIDPYGGMYPCGYIIDYLPNNEENILKTDPITIWQTSEQFLFKRNLKGNNTCNQCEFFVSCRGGCRARAIYQHHDINSPDSFCRKRMNINQQYFPLFKRGGFCS